MPTQFRQRALSEVAERALTKGLPPQQKAATLGQTATDGDATDDAEEKPTATTPQNPVPAPAPPPPQPDQVAAPDPYAGTRAALSQEADFSPVDLFKLLPML